MGNLKIHNRQNKILAVFMILILFIIMIGINRNYVYADVPPQVVVGFDFEDAGKRVAPHLPYVADNGTPDNKINSTISLTGATYTAWVAGAGGSGTFAPNSNGWNSSGSAYWKIEFTTIGYEALTLSSKQSSSNTGPRDFQVQWSLDNSNWSNVPSATITVANNWTAGVLNNVSLPTEMKNQAKVYLRWMKSSNVSVNSGTVATTGTNRIDDIIIRGEPLTYTVTYDGNEATGGSVPANQNKIFGQPLTLQNNTGNLVKTGCNFTGWNTAKDGTGISYAAGGSFTHDAETTLFAQWSEAYYSVSFAPGDYGTFVKTTTEGLLYGDSTPSAPAVTGKAGFTFVGWSPDLAETVRGDATYTALWSQDGPVVFYHIYGGGGNVNGVYQNDFVVLKNISDKPVDLSGWTIRYASSQGTTWTESNPLNGIVCPGNFYVIRAWFGNNSPPQPAIPYFHADLPQLAIHLKEYKMSLRDDENVEIDFVGTGNADEFLGDGAAPATADSGGQRNQQSVIRNMALANPFSGNNNLDYKVQETTDLSYLIGQTYTVSFDNNTGDPEDIPRQITATHGNSINPLPEPPPQRQGYTFSGWNTKADGTGTVFDQETKVTACLTVYAQYTRNDYAVEFVAGTHGTFDVNGAPANQQVLYKDPATAPTVVTDPGYTFTGWDKAFDSVTGDMVITAQYTRNVYTVEFKVGEHGTFDPSGALANQEVLYKDPATAPTVIVDAGYTFAGWDKTFDSVTGDMVITAQYTRNVYTIVFSIGEGSTFHGGGGTQTQIVMHGNAIVVPENPSRPGFTFAGWYTDETYTNKYVFGNDLLGNLVLYAKWTKNNKEGLPYTGDESNLPILLLLCVLGCIGMGFQVRHIKKS